MRRSIVPIALLVLVVFQTLPAQARVIDADGDRVDDAVDLCPTVTDPFQGDHDGDGVGDLCDSDSATMGTPGDDLLIATSGADTTLEGSGGDDALYGGAGDDTLDGGAGRDFLAGGGGIDRLTGGSDCDVFAVDPDAPGGTITDFQPGVDRFAFPPLDDDPSDDPVPEATFGGDDHLTMSFGEDAGLWVFDGVTPSTPISLDTSPCAPRCEYFFGEPLAVPAMYGVIEVILDGALLVGTYDADTLIGTACGDLIFGDGTDLFGPVPQTPDPGLTLSDDLIYGLSDGDLIIGDEWELPGGSVGGDDTIYGGSGDDAISGDAWMVGGSSNGTPTCTGCATEVTPANAWGGDDTLFGGTGNDVIAGDGFSLTDYAIGGDDVIDGGAGENILTGDGYEVTDHAHGGDDTITGGPGYDLITGDASVLSGHAAGGHDTILGGEGDDIIGGDAGEDMSDESVGGNDIIDGGAGDDVIYGDSGSFMTDFSIGGDDLLYGGSGDDLLRGDAVGIEDAAIGGQDLLDGGTGDDTLYGDANPLNITATGGAADIFRFDTASAFGDDIVVDPGAGGAGDLISLVGAGDLSAIDARSTITESFSDVIAVVFSDPTRTTRLGSITLFWVATGSVDSWADIDALTGLDVQTLA